MHFDRRGLVDPQHAKVVEVGLLHAAVLERHFAPERAADSENDAAFDLCLDRVRVYNHTAIDGADDSVHADLGGLRHGDLGDLCQVAAPRAVEKRDAAAAAFG